MPEHTSNVMTMLSLAGKVALVTGGSGNFGRPMVRALAQAGAKVYVASRNVTKLEAWKRELSDEQIHIGMIPYDQGDETSILAMRDQLMAREGRIDCLINNAVAFTMKDWNESPLLFEESLHINATGLFIVTRAFGEVMARQKSGSIINIASIHGMIGPDRWLYQGPVYDDPTKFKGFRPDYYFHKGGLISFTRFVAGYLGADNVRCNAISLGGYYEQGRHNEQFVSRYSSRTFLGRMANETDIMGIAVFLASDASAYITGANIPVEGGYTAK